MKILLVSQVPAYFEQFRKSNEIFPHLQAQYHWLEALKSLGHEVEVFKYSDPIIGSRKFWSKYFLFFEKKLPRLINKYRYLRNKFYNYLPDNYFRSFLLKKLIKDFQPELVIFSGGISELFGTSIEYLNKKTIPVILIHGVHPKEGATQYEKDFIGLFDLIVTNDPTHSIAWKKIGAKKTVALPYSGINPTVHKYLKLKRIYDLVFVGTIFKERILILEEILNQGIDLKLFGYIPKHVKLSKKLEQIYQGEVWGNELIKLLNRSKMVLNLVPDHMSVGGNLRTFEIPGCGAMQVANRCPQKWFLHGKEIVIFDSVTDLKQKVDHYLKNTQKLKEISQAGYNRVHREYTYENRFKKLLSLI